MNNNIDILLWGIYFCDLIFNGLDEFPQIGKEIYSNSFHIVPGACFTTALALTRLGIQTGWSCDFGNDLFSNFVLDNAKNLGINNQFFQYHNFPINRVTASLSYPQNRAFISFIDDVPQTPIEPSIKSHHPKWLLLPHLHYGPEYTNLFEVARQCGVKIYMDCQSINVTLQTSGVIEALKSVDVFAPNYSESLQLTGENNIHDAITCLSKLTPTVVIKLGSDGAIARQGDYEIAIEGLKVQVVDTTGAGDCFNAGFLYGKIKNATLDDCIKYGNICGALSTGDFGGCAAPTKEQMETYLCNQ